MGYLNVEGPSGKRIIVPDPNSASVITELYDQFATGKYSVRSLAVKFRLEGGTLRGRPLNTSLVQSTRTTTRFARLCGAFPGAGFGLVTICLNEETKNEQREQSRDRSNRIHDRVRLEGLLDSHPAIFLHHPEARIVNMRESRTAYGHGEGH